MPWLECILKEVDGNTLPFSVLGVSGGGVAAYGLVRDYLIPAGLIPHAFISIGSTPPGIPNPHIERTKNPTAENAKRILSYYSVLGDMDLEAVLPDLEPADAAALLQAQFGPVLELTRPRNDSEEAPLLDIPAFVFGMETDPIVDWDKMGYWSRVFTQSAWEKGLGKVCALNPAFNHFFQITRQDEEAFREVFFKHGVMEKVLALGNR